MKISVIIPFYNVSPFIERCARTLLEQTLEDVEFIFVDDASPDDSRSILGGVIAKHPDRNVRIVTHEVNKGLPAARNTGLAYATGEYVYHCDSDDWLEKDMLEKMYRAAREKDADMVYCDYYLSFAESERLMVNPSFTSADDLLRKGFLSGSTKYNVWNKITRRSLFTDNGILFPSGHSMGEDMTMIMLASHAKSVAHVAKGLYHYVKVNQGAMTQTLSQRQLDDTRFNADRALKYIKGRLGGEEEKYVAFLKLNVKLPFLMSGDKSQYALWRKWFPEADSYAMENKVLPFRVRMIQWLAAKEQFWLVTLYSWVIAKLYYGLKYK